MSINNLKTLLFSIVFTLLFSTVYAQDNADESYHSVLETAKVSSYLYFTFSGHNSIIHKSKKDIESSSGSYLTENSNLLNVDIGVDVIYDKVELFSRNFKKTVFSSKVKTSRNKIDLTGVVPGSYVLILTNRRGNIKTEQLLIY